MTNIGPMIKKIRVNKQMKKRELYEGIVSKSFSYYFEKGEYDINFSRLYCILQRLNIDLEELLFISSGYLYQTPHNTVYAIMDSFQSDTDSLHKIFEENYFKRDRYHKYLGSLSYALYASKKGYPVNDDITEGLIDYFMHLNFWTLNDIELCSYAYIVFNAIFQKDRVAFDKITKNILNYLELYYQANFQIEKVEIILCEFYWNCSQVFWTNNEIEKGKRWQDSFLSKFTDLHSINSHLNIKCVNLIFNFFDKEKHSQSVKEYKEMMTFLCEMLPSDHNKQLIEVGQFFENYSQRYFDSLSRR